MAKWWWLGGSVARWKRWTCVSPMPSHCTAIPKFGVGIGCAPKSSPYQATDAARTGAWTLTWLTRMAVMARRPYRAGSAPRSARAGCETAHHHVRARTAREPEGGSSGSSTDRRAVRRRAAAVRLAPALQDLAATSAAIPLRSRRRPREDLHQCAPPSRIPPDQVQPPARRLRRPWPPCGPVARRRHGAAARPRPGVRRRPDAGAGRAGPGVARRPGVVPAARELARRDAHRARAHGAARRRRGPRPLHGIRQGGVPRAGRPRRSRAALGRRARRPPRAPRRQLAGARAVPRRRARPPLRRHRRPLAGDRRPAPEPGDEPRQRARLQHGDRPAAAARGAPARDALASRRPVGRHGGRRHARADPAHAQPAGLDGARPPPVGLDRARRARPPWDRVALRRGLAAARRAAHRAGPAHAPRRPRRARRLSGRRARGRSGGALAHPDGQVGRQRRGGGGELEQRRLDRHGPRDHRDRDAVVGAAGDLDLVARADLALAHDAQVRAGPLRPREALEHLRVAEAQAELEARKARLADLELDRAEPPALADQRPAHVDALDREVLAERPRTEPDAELALPPRRVLARVRVDRLVGAAVDAAVGLVVAGDVHALDADAAAADRRLADRALHGAATAQADRLRAAD